MSNKWFVLKGVFAALLSIALLGGCGATGDGSLQKKVKDLEALLKLAEDENAKLTLRARDLATENAMLKVELANAKIPQGDIPDLETFFARFKDMMPGWSQEGVSLVKEVPEAVLFDLGDYTLKAESHKTLDSIAADLQQFIDKGMVVRVEGHTDDVRIRKDGKLFKNNIKTNMLLGAFRANTVWEYLIEKHGLSKDKLFISSFGENLPVAENAANFKGNRENRRVKFVATPSSLKSLLGVKKGAAAPKKKAAEEEENAE